MIRRESESIRDGEDREQEEHDDRKYDRRYGVHFFKCRSGTCFCRDSSAWFDTPHGVANSLFLPYIMEFNIPACPERFADIADAMGIEREESMSDEQYALKAVEYCESFEQKIKHSYN